jgi:hypothetical protein
VRFRDLLGRSEKNDADPSRGRLVTAPEAPLPVPPADRESQEPRPPRTAPSSPDVPVADRFALLLAEEQGEAPVVPRPAAPPALTLTDRDIDRIALRVAERLADTPLAADLQRVVAEVSERLVKEEIQRIRQAAESRLSSDELANDH